MKKSRIFTFLAGLFLSVCLLSCSSLFEARLGTITVNLPHSHARSAFSAGDITHYEMLIFAASQDIPVQKKTVPASSRTIQSDPLEDGIYSVTLNALRNGSVIGTGTTSDDQPAEIYKGKSSPVDIIIQMNEIQSLSVKTLVKDNNGKTISPVIIDGITGIYYIVEPSKTYSIKGEVSGGVSPYTYSWMNVDTQGNFYSTSSEFSHSFTSSTELMILTTGDQKNTSITSPALVFYRPVITINSITTTYDITTVNFSTGCPLPAGNISISIDGESPESLVALLIRSDYTYTVQYLTPGKHTVSIQYQYEDINKSTFTLPAVETEFTISDSTATPASNEFYVKGSSTGGDGSEANPFSTLGQALSKINSDDSITEATVFLKSAACNFTENPDATTDTYIINKTIHIKAQKNNTVISLNSPKTQLLITQDGSVTFDASDYSSMSIGAESEDAGTVELQQALIINNGGKLSLMNAGFNYVKSLKPLIIVQSSGTFDFTKGDIKYNTCENILTVNGSTANLITGSISHNTCTTGTDGNGTIVAQNNAVINIGQKEASTSSFFQISRNTSQNAGAIYTKNGVSAYPTVNILSNVLMQNNISTESTNSTGGIYISDGSTVNIKGKSTQIDTNWLVEEKGSTSNFLLSETGKLFVNDELKTTIPSKVNLQ